MKTLTLVLGLSSAASAADTAVFVNAATDGGEGEHSLKVLRDAVLKLDPDYARRVKSAVVLEEPVAHAPPSAKQIVAEVNRLLGEGKSAYNRGNLDAASEDVAQAEAMALATEPLPEVFTALAELERLTGLLALKAHDNAAADEAFRNAFTLNPEFQSLDSAMGVYGRMLKSKNPGSGTLVIRVEPLTAWVMIDGKKASSGVSAQLEAGTHFVSASREGYQGQLQRIKLPAGKTVPVAFTLPEASLEPDLIVGRATVLAAQTEAARAMGARHLAELMKARYVVLVRPDDAALYDAATAQLGPWVKIEPAVTAIGEALKGAPPRPLITDAEVARARAAEEVQTAPATEWYRRPWVIGAGAGAVVLIAGAVVLGVVLGSHHPPTYTIDNWCHASDCPPLN